VVLTLSAFRRTGRSPAHPNKSSKNLLVIQLILLLIKNKCR
jgi:hypothetical protein